MEHIFCKPLEWTNGLEPIDFYWDEKTGEVSGKSGDTVKKWAEMAGERIAINPIPRSHQLSQEPLKSRKDIAALLGMWYELPEWLAGYYPSVEEDEAQEDEIY